MLDTKLILAVGPWYSQIAQAAIDAKSPAFGILHVLIKARIL